ncbi:MAG TPA: hypothetical protein VMT52_05575, partial [Planctomycetota bacterium]|nr:hypothetical protein [Planctomycetota bacterium]
MNLKKLLVVTLVAVLTALPGCEKNPAPGTQPAGTDGTAPAGAKTAESTPAGAAISAPTGTSSFVGTVRVNGTAPAPQPVNMAAKPECAAHSNTPADNLIVSADKGLKDAVV